MTVADIDPNMKKALKMKMVTEADSNGKDPRCQKLGSLDCWPIYLDPTELNRLTPIIYFF